MLDWRQHVKGKNFYHLIQYMTSYMTYVPTLRNAAADLNAGEKKIGLQRVHIECKFETDFSLCEKKLKKK